MITNFEEITQELNEEELKLLSLIVRGFKNYSKENPIKAPDIVSRLNKFLINNKIETSIKITEARLRKYVNYIRQNTLLPLIATSKGYFVSYDVEEIRAQIKSLEERAKSIKDAANGLYFFVEQITKGMQP
jgi:predicted RNase H-related nuclease YkuK (DUF458 family)